MFVRRKRGKRRDHCGHAFSFQRIAAWRCRGRSLLLEAQQRNAHIQVLSRIEVCALNLLDKLGFVDWFDRCGRLLKPRPFYGIKVGITYFVPYNYPQLL